MSVFRGHAQTRKRFTTMRTKELGVQKYCTAVPCLCSKYHFSEGKLSGTSYLDEKYFFYTCFPLPQSHRTTEILLSFFFCFTIRWFLKRNTWAFLSAVKVKEPTRFLGFKNEPSFNVL